MKNILIFTLVVLLLSACMPSQQTTSAPATFTPDVETMVAETFAALTVQAALTQPANAPTQTPTPEPGSISGTLSYPSEFIPPLRVVAFPVNGFNYRWVDTMENQSTYQITGLTPGLYHVVAYIMDGTYAGGYTQMVPCGLSASCADHSLIEVEVKSGQDAPNVNPGDWYAPPGTFPAMP